jgi:hypothetical protein
MDNLTATSDSEGNLIFEESGYWVAAEDAEAFRASGFNARYLRAPQEVGRRRASVDPRTLSLLRGETVLPQVEKRLVEAGIPLKEGMRYTNPSALPINESTMITLTAAADGDTVIQTANTVVAFIPLKVVVVGNACKLNHVKYVNQPSWLGNGGVRSETVGPDVRQYPEELFKFPTEVASSQPIEVSGTLDSAGSTYVHIFGYSATKKGVVCPS